MIDLQFDNDLELWSWARPAGPALSASHEVAGGVLVEVDLADPAVLTGLTATHSEGTRRLLSACFGSAAAQLFDARSSGSIDLDVQGERARSLLGRWVVAADTASRQRADDDPLAVAGWLIDAALIGSRATVELGLAPVALDTDRQLLRSAVAGIAAGPELRDASEYLLRRLARAAEDLSRHDLGFAVVVEMLSSLLGGMREAKPSHCDVPVSIGGDLDPNLVTVSVFRQNGNLIVHLNPALPGLADQQLIARVSRPDGTLLALASARWTTLHPPGRAQLMVPDHETIELEITRQADSTSRHGSADEPAKHATAIGDEHAAILGAPSPQADVAFDALQVVTAQRLGTAIPEDWAEVGRRWAALSDDDRAWLALEHALALSQPGQRLGSGDPARDPRAAQRLNDETERRHQLETISASLHPTWAAERPETAGDHAAETYLGDELAQLLEQEDTAP